MSDIIWTMEQDYCDNCGAYLYEGGFSDDNSGLCSTCFDLWMDEIGDEDEEYDYDEVEETGERVKELFYQKLKEKHPDSPWLNENKTP